MTADTDDPGARLLAEIAEHYREGTTRGYLRHDPVFDLRDLRTTRLPILINALAGVGRTPGEGRRPVRRKRAHLQMLLTVVHALAERGPVVASACDALIGALEDRSVRLRCAAVDALAWMRESAAAAVPALLTRLVKDRHPTVRALSAWALGVIGSPQPAITAALVPALDAPCPLVREAAAISLGKLARGDEAVGQLLEDNFILDDVNRPALAVALAQVAPDRLVGFAVRQPDIFWVQDRASDRFTYDPWPRRGWWAQRRPAPGRSSYRWPPRPSCSQILMRLAALAADAAPVREVFVRLIPTRVRDSALHGLARVGGAARDALPVIARNPNRPAQEALRAISFAAWHEDERRANADPTAWRERLLDRLRRRWERRPIASEARTEIENLVRTGVRHDVLIARMRIGDVAPERVALAALLGDEAARKALDWRDEDIEPPDGDAFRRWARPFEAVPIEARIRIAHAATRDVIAVWHSYWPACDRGTEALHAMENWMLEPGREARNRLASRMDFGTTQGDDNPYPVWALRVAAELVLRPETTLGHGCALPTALASWETDVKYRREEESHWRSPIWDPPIDVAALIRRLRRAVREWVVPWALGEVDPVGEPLAQLFATDPRLARHSR